MYTWCGEGYHVLLIGYSQGVLVHAALYTLLYGAVMYSLLSIVSSKSVTMVASSPGGQSSLLTFMLCFSLQSDVPEWRDI